MLPIGWLYTLDIQPMLILTHEPETGAPRLIVCNPYAVAWIGPYRRLNEHFRPENEVHNWKLWVQRSDLLPPRSGKSPTGILVESHLRAWLLQRFKLKLRDLRFEELCAVAEATQKHPAKGRV
jgi:hypothetical protein